MNNSDKILLSYVQNEINSGKTKIVIPIHMISNASSEEISEIKQLCKLNGVEIKVM